MCVWGGFAKFLFCQCEDPFVLCEYKKWLQLSADVSIAF